MTLVNRYLIFDPGFLRLMLALRGSFLFALLALSGAILFKVGTVSILFIAMASIFALVNLFAPTLKEHFKSSLRASVMLYSAVLLGLYFPFPEALETPIFLCTVFIAYFITRFGQGWFFHPVVSSILLMVTMSLPIQKSELDSLSTISLFAAFAFLLSLTLQFVIFRSKNRVAVIASLQSVFHCLEQTYKKLSHSKRQDAKLIWKRANEKTNLLIQYSRRIDERFSQKKDIELFTIELYGLVRLTLNLLDSVKELEKTFYKEPLFREKVESLIANLEYKVHQLLLQESGYENPVVACPFNENADEKSLLPELLHTLKEKPPKEELSPLYLFCFSYRKSLELLASLEQKLISFERVQ